MPFEGRCASANVAAERSHELQEKMRQSLARWSVEPDEGRRKRIFVEYATMLCLWVEYTLEHLDWLARSEEPHRLEPRGSENSLSGI